MNVYKVKLTKRTGDSLYLTPNSYLYIEETDDKCSIINFTGKHTRLKILRLKGLEDSTSSLSTIQKYNYGRI